MQLTFREETEEILEEDTNQIKDPNWTHPSSTKKSINTSASDFYPCLDHCQKKFKTERALLRHQESEISSKLNCEKCGRKFRNEIIWKSHQDKCTGQTYAKACIIFKPRTL